VGWAVEQNPARQNRGFQAQQHAQAAPQWLGNQTSFAVLAISENSRANADPSSKAQAGTAVRKRDGNAGPANHANASNNHLGTESAGEVEAGCEARQQE